MFSTFAIRTGCALGAVAVLSACGGSSTTVGFDGFAANRYSVFTSDYGSMSARAQAAYDQFVADNATPATGVNPPAPSLFSRDDGAVVRTSGSGGTTFYTADVQFLYDGSFMTGGLRNFVEDGGGALSGDTLIDLQGSGATFDFGFIENAPVAGEGEFAGFTGEMDGFFAEGDTDPSLVFVIDGSNNLSGGNRVELNGIGTGIFGVPEPL